VNSYASTLRFLFGLQSRGMKFGLRNIRALLLASGNPHLQYPALHVAGTNGKGSTSAFLASMFMEAGYRTALYTSPHLVRFTERIRINGREMAEKALVGYCDRLHDAIEACGATFFEATTCIAFLYFAEQEVDLAVIEAGLGGRLDSTNVLRPMASFITNISLEHTELLGNTIASIAREKAGIIKDGIPVVIGALAPEAEKVIRNAARGRGATLHRAAAMVRTSELPGGRLRVVMPSGATFAANPGLRGAFQERNIAQAVAGVAVLLRSKKFRDRFPLLSLRAIRRGIERVRKNTGLRARFQIVRNNGRWLIDVAHNPAGMDALVDQLRTLKPRPATAVFGVMSDKKFGEMLGSLASVLDTVVLVAPRSERAAPVSALMEAARRHGVRAVRGGSVERGLAKARALDPAGTILVTGSHYVAGEALSEFTKT
jgi:dihydrofolate synthase/folylpolyglutamate synthase